MFHVVLHEPEIPPNTGNVVRLCANAGCRLHLIEPLGFDVDDRALRRAGLDHHERAAMRVHPSVEALLAALPGLPLFTFSTRHAVRYDVVRYPQGSILMFGSETRGLPEDVRRLGEPERRVAIPVAPGTRSINLSNCVAVAVFEAWRQHDFRLAPP